MLQKACSIIAFRKKGLASAVFEKLSSIQKLGQALQAKCPDWEIRLIHDFEREPSGDYLREIIHQTPVFPLVYARVEVPAETYAAFESEFSALGGRSIGDAFLFVRDDVTREAFVMKEIEVSTPFYDCVKTHLKEEGPFVARASVFKVSGHPLTIAEFFGKRALNVLGAEASK